MRKETVIGILENAVKQQELCNKLFTSIDAEVNDWQSDIHVYVECVTGLTEKDLGIDVWDEIINKVYFIIDEETTQHERAEKIYEELTKFKRPDASQVFELKGTLRMVG